MAQPQRSDAEFTAQPTPTTRPAPEGPVDNGYFPGGQVGQMHADLAKRLVGGLAGQTVPVPLDEQIVRFLSVTGGYVALAAAYAGLAFAILR